MWVTPEGLANHLEKQCLPDPIQPEDVAGTVLFLASDASKMMTSQTLILDGGYISG
jgi:NAD(P)-dependent dehydrogenase (short-subunit alcohol dehydrogenase family)